MKSTADIAKEVGAERWQIVRLFETGELPEPPKFVGRRVINAALEKEIIAALECRGWISEENAVAVR